MNTFKDNFRKFKKDPLFYVVLISGAVALALAVSSAFVDYETKRYTVHALWVGGFAALIVCVIALVKAYKKYFREDGKRFKTKLGEKIVNFFAFVEDAIRKALHLAPRIAYFGGVDERVKLYTAPGAKPDAKGLKKDVRIKWKNLEENRLKIRFLYAGFVGGHINSGYKFKYSKTARQIGAELCNGERDELLFELYEDIRYTDHETEISDETIEYLTKKEDTEKSKKKKRKG